MQMDDPIAIVRKAIAIRDDGRHAEAAVLLTRLLKEIPSLEAAYYELAFMHRLQGQHREAVRTLEAALEHDAKGLRILTLCGHMLHAAGAHAEGNACLNKVRPTTKSERDQLQALFEFGNYLQCFPLGRSLILLDRLKQRCRWLEAAEVAEQASAALRNHQPFALLRLGDGEGGMLTLSQQDEAHYPSLYRRNRKELIGMWFGLEFEWQDSQFWTQAQRLPEAIGAATVVGIPYESWLKHEYGISSLRGVPSLTNIYRYFTSGGINGCICSQHIHLDLFRSGYLISLIKSAEQVHVVTCLPEIAEVLRDRLGINNIVAYSIPAEQGSKTALGPNAGTGIHYPNVFNALLEKLSNPPKGSLFLVAAGLLGKFYCQAIKNGGGVSIDIGSLIDAWLQRPTRPGYDASLSL